jgi:hypothetical protein
MGAVTWTIRQRSVSHPRSSHRTCGATASGSLTGHARAPLGHLPLYGDCVDYSGELGLKTIAMSLKMRPWCFLISGSKSSL